MTCPGPCINLPGTYACNCSIPGYRSTSNLQFCGDVDECLENNGGCEDVCVNTRGSFNCRCEKSGFKMGNDKKTCQDIDECNRYKNRCNTGGFCFNTHGSFVCECGEGFTVSSNKAECKDNDECLLENGGCQHVCVNTPGIYHCECRPGFQLRRNNKTCYDINECETDNGGCQDRCVNTIGSFRCICLKRGYIIGDDQISCLLCPVDMYYRGRRRTGRCLQCPPNSRTNGPGKKFKRSCKCNIGFRGIPVLKVECTDIDECQTSNFGCAYGCENSPGSAHCTCPEGFKLTPDEKNCDDIDECQTSNFGCAYGCENSPGSAHCTCPEGFKLTPDEKNCDDLDECSVNNGGCEDYCINEDGSSRCECQQTGFILAQDGKACIDVDECLLDNFNCSDICINSVGSAQCNCSHGYFLEVDGKTCNDTDECGTDNGNCEDACLNIPGSFQCDCKTAGYRLHSDRRSCEDINECYEQSGLCDDTCRNTKGSYICFCRNAGFVLNTDGRTCDDIDECLSSSTNECDHFCVNTHGSYRCVCQPGYVIHGLGGCRECSKDSYSSGNDSNCLTCPVHSHTMATRRVSRGECICKDGFHGDLNSHTECEDIDECADDQFGCSHDCVNVMGSAYCACPRGFELLKDKKTCKDRDECSYKNGQCEHTCVNTPGAFHCECRAGFESNPYQTFRCQDINECRPDNGGCSHICVNTDGSYYCTCSRKFYMTRDRKTCKERFCYILPIPSFGDMRPNACSTPSGGGISVDTTCFFSCPDAYKLLGSSRRTCLNTGNWGGVDAQCIAKECPRLKKPKHGLVFPKRCTRWNSEVLDKCYYGCAAGYSRIGNAFTTCTSQENWSHPPPSCVIESNCEKLIGPFNGKPTCERKKEGRIECKPTCSAGKTFYSSPSNLTYVCSRSVWSPSDTVPDCVGFRKQESEVECFEGAEYRINTTACVQCPRGSFRMGQANTSGPKTCLPCSLGSYQDNIGSSKCKPCPDGWTTSVSKGAYSVEQCDVNIEEFSGDVEDFYSGSGEETNISSDDPRDKSKPST